MSKMEDSAETPNFSQIQTVFSTDPETKGFDLSSGKKWIYPENFPIREYQYRIVEAALYNNTLVCLPTGLGKTFIAAVVMYNFWRWYPRGKVVFMAPTKPLVNQQITACQNIMGITSSEYVELTGNTAQKNRLEAWVKKRIIFATPQIFHRDLEKEIIPIDSIKCVVVDEAHKALGKYAYCEAIRILSQCNINFRVLALSATPGNKTDKVQEVVQNLLISHLELRTDQSPDIVPYVNEREIVTVMIPLERKFLEFKDAYVMIMDPHLKKLVNNNVMKSGNAQDITKGRIFNLQKQYQQFQMKAPNHSIIMNELNIMMTMAHGYELMVRNGLRAFHNFYQNHSDKYWFNCETRLHELLERIATYLGPFPDIQPMPDGTIEEVPTDIVFGHAKFHKTRELLSNHFRNAEKENKPSRAIVFVEYRDSAKEIYMLLLQLRPLVRPQIFVGQAGQRQKQQLQALTDFKNNKVNVLISTSVGEEGLDVGEVDLIICFDVSQNSPTRLVQRMGRTGRQRDGKIFILVTPGKEYQVLRTMMKEKNTMNDKVLVSPIILSSLYQKCPRMVPANFHPQCHKMSFVAQPALPQVPKKRGKKGATEKKIPDQKPRAQISILDLLNSKKPDNQFTAQKYFKKPQFDPNNLDDFAIPNLQSNDRKNDNDKISPFNVQLLLNDNLSDKFLTLCAMRESESARESEIRENFLVENYVTRPSLEFDVFAIYRAPDFSILDRLDKIFSDENVEEFYRRKGFNDKNCLESQDVTEIYDTPANHDYSSLDGDKIVRFPHERSNPDSKRQSMNHAFIDDDLDAELLKDDFFQDFQHVEDEVERSPEKNSPSQSNLFDHLLSWEESEESQEEQVQPGQNEQVQAGQDGQVQAGQSEQVQAGQIEQVQPGQSEQVQPGQSEQVQPGQNELSQSPKLGSAESGLFDHLFTSEESLDGKVQGNNEDVWNIEEETTTKKSQRKPKPVDSDEDMFIEDFSDSETEANVSGSKEVAQVVDEQNEILSATLGEAKSEEDIFAIDDDSGDYMTAQEFPKSKEENKDQVFCGLETGLFEDDDNAWDPENLEILDEKGNKTEVFNFSDLRNEEFEDKGDVVALENGCEKEELGLGNTSLGKDVAISKSMNETRKSCNLESFNLSFGGFENEDDDVLTSKYFGGIEKSSALENKDSKGEAVSNEETVKNVEENAKSSFWNLSQLENVNFDDEEETAGTSTSKVVKPALSFHDGDDDLFELLFQKTQKTPKTLQNYTNNNVNIQVTPRKLDFGPSKNISLFSRSPERKTQERKEKPMVMTLRGKNSNEFDEDDKISNFKSKQTDKNDGPRKAISQNRNYKFSGSKAKNGSASLSGFNSDIENQGCLDDTKKSDKNDGPSRKAISQNRNHKFSGSKGKNGFSSFSGLRSDANRGFSDDTDDEFLVPAQKSKPKVASQSRLFKKPEPVGKFQSTSKTKKKSKKTEKRKKNAFVIEEAEVSSGADTSGGDSDECGDMDKDLEGFVSHTQHFEGDEMRAHYMRTVQSPNVGNFHFRPLKHMPREMIYSQYVPEEHEDYQNDSFCVDENEEESLLDISHLEYIEKQLRQKKRRKNPKRKIISSASGSDDSDCTFLKKKPRKNSSSEDEVEKLRKQLKSP